MTKQKNKAQRASKKTLIVATALSLLGLAMGDASLLMANATPLEGGGSTRADFSDGKNNPADPNNQGAHFGISTVSNNSLDGDPEYYSKDIDKRITRIRPMSTPVDQITRYADARKVTSLEVKYYSVGTRPVMCKTNKLLAKQTTGASVTLPVNDPNMFTIDDTIRVVGIKGKHDDKGVECDPADPNTPDLVLCVCGRDTNTSMPVVYAVNGEKDAKGHPIYVPEIPAGTTLVRMGKAVGELDVQTGRFNNLPTAEYQYCQNFMAQVEQSTIDKMSAKEIDWDFSELEEDSIYDMRIGMENTFLFGAKNKVYHTSKDGMAQWFTEGIWWQAGKDIEVGEWDGANTIIRDEHLVDITKDLFVGTDISSDKRKLMFCGSDMLAALSKIKSDKFFEKESVEFWNLKFRSFVTEFGEVLTMHHDLFDINGMSDCALAIDPEFLTKVKFQDWGRHILDLKTAGVRNTDAVVLQEISAVYLRYPKAHARMRLAKA